MKSKALKLLFGLFMPLALLAAVACGGAEKPDTPSVSAEPVTPAEAPLRIALASSDLSVGLNRVVFGLIDAEAGALRDADVTVSTFFLGDGGQEGPIEVVGGEFRQWPAAPGGVYTTQLTFDRPGRWGFGVEAVQGGGEARQATASVEVREESLTPAIGEAAPPSVTKTVSDVADLDELTSDLDPDPELYAMTVAEALETSRPLVVAFSTPAYCQTATCGPQLDVVKELKAEHGENADFIHVEVYDNPDEIQGDLSRARTAPAVTEWALPSEPWTFIVDAEGLIAYKFEGFATRDELETALAKVLP